MTDATIETIEPVLVGPDPFPTIPALAKKLATAYTHISRVPKRGRNTFHNYDFATEADVSEGVRAALAEVGVAFFVSIAGYETDARQTGQGKPTALYTVALDITFVDGESGEHVSVRWYGQGLDSEDKGLSKATTSGVKYCLLKTFLIATGDDPDADGDPDGTGAKTTTRRSSTTRRTGSASSGAEATGEGTGAEPDAGSSETPAEAGAGPADEPTNPPTGGVDRRIDITAEADKSKPATSAQWDAAKGKFGNTAAILRAYIAATGSTKGARRQDISISDMDDLLGPGTAVPK